MSEPTVEVPARLALLACKFMFQMGPYTDSNAKIQAASNELQDIIAGQLSSEELDVAFVTARLQESA